MPTTRSAATRVVLPLAGALVAALAVACSGSPSVSPTTSAPVPAGPRVVGDDFESGSATGWTESSGIPIESVRGGRAARLDAREGPAWALMPLAEPVLHAAASARVRISGTPALGAERAGVLALRTAGGAPVAALTVGAGGTLGVANGLTGVPMGVPMTIRTGTWHTVGLEVDVAGPASTLTVSVDDFVVETWTTDLGDSPLGRVLAGEDTLDRGADVLYDTVSAGPAEDLPTATPKPRRTEADPVLFAAGDIACDPLSSSFGKAEDPTSGSCQMRAVADLVLGDSAATVVAALGDVQYYCGGVEAFELSYDPTWGRFLDITRPAVGNHEYIDRAEDDEDTECDATGTAKPYFDYFGERAGGYGRGYYSYDVGTWHVVVLNTTCSQAGGCHEGSPQAGVAACRPRCALAYWHIPLWSSGGRANENSRVFTEILHEAGADVVLAGHDHLYERFAPQDAEDRADPDGLRGWVVGTGGANHTGVENSAANSVVVDPVTFGILRMVLRDGTYDWTFLPANGAPFTDTGSAFCH